MKARVVIFVVILFLTLSIQQPTYALDKKISTSEATQLISKHFSGYYSLLYIGIRTFEQTQIGGFTQMKNLAQRMEKTGLIKYSVNAVGTGQQKLITELTEKARQRGYITKFNEPNVVGFLFGQREFQNIIEITEDNTVFFSYKYIPSNDQCIAWPEVYNVGNEYRERGKATIKFDPFLQKYIPRGFMMSTWDREEWLITTWTDTRNDKKVALVGVEK